MFCAITGPTPGSVSRAASSAVLRSIGPPAGAEAAPLTDPATPPETPDATSPAAGAAPTTTESPSANLAARFIPVRSALSHGATGSGNRISDPGTGIQRDHVPAAHQTGDRDDDLARCSRVPVAASPPDPPRRSPRRTATAGPAQRCRPCPDAAGSDETASAATAEVSTGPRFRSIAPDAECGGNGRQCRHQQQDRSCLGGPDRPGHRAVIPVPTALPACRMVLPTGANRA